MEMVCDNCCRRFGAEAQLVHVFPDIPDLLTRIGPGGTVPRGECPDCGCLVYDAPGAGYVVNWSVDVDARSCRHAAELALEMQRDPESTAVVFEVVCRASGARETVDLQAEASADDEGRISAYRCRVCGDLVAGVLRRGHLESHNPNAAGMEWADVEAQFASTDAGEPPPA